MALIELTLEGKIDKVKKAISRIQAYAFDVPVAAISGGKDSVVLDALCQMAGIKYEPIYNVTSVDPPELVRFIKYKMPHVKRQIPRDKDGNPITMWNLIPRKHMPPTRLARYCCAELKESQNSGRITFTGVRWAESQRRAQNQGLINSWGKALAGAEGAKVNKSGGIIMNDDNDENRHMVENCFRTNKTLVNPIIDWTDEDVWEFIRSYNVPYCELYDCGFKRIGCLGCPMNTRAARELETYPEYKALYIKAFDKMLEEMKTPPQTWRTGRDVYNWWIGLNDRSKKNTEFEQSLIEQSGIEIY